MPTIKDIAREAGVSHGTVSNVLNKTGKVSIEKIKLVEEAARKLGYVPNAQAQMLRQGTPTSVALLLPTLREDIYLDLYQSLQTAMHKNGYETFIYETNCLKVTNRQSLKRFRFPELLPLSLFPACLIPSLLPIRPFPVLFFLQKEFRNSFPKTSMPSHLIIGLQANALHRSQKKTVGKESPSSVIQTISAAAGSFLPESGRLSGAVKKKYRYFLLISALPLQRPSALSRRKLPSTVS